MDALYAMRVFVRVVEAGNFTRAADSLGVPRATVTKQIQALEARLHTRLLNRTTRRVSVTPDGAAYYERSARLLSDFDDIEAGMIDAQASPRGRLRVDLTSAVARQIVVPALGGFLARYPDIEIDFGVSERVLNFLSENVDVAVRVGEIADPSLVAKRIGVLRCVTVASPAYVARHGAPSDPRDLAAGPHQMIGFFTTDREQRRCAYVYDRDHERVEITPQARFWTSDITAHLEALLSGLGLSQTLELVAEPHLRSGALIALLPQWTRAPLPVSVVYPPNRHLSARVRAFVDWVAELFAADPRLRSADLSRTLAMAALQPAGARAADASARSVLIPALATARSVQCPHRREAKP